MNTWQSFWAMGGYAFYVWTAYGLSAAILLLNVLLPLAREKRLLRELRGRSPVSDSQ
jgi:heme exporter protein D